VDCYSRHTWVFFLPDKSSTTVTPGFEELTSGIWTKFHHLKYKICRFWCDNRKGEYNNSRFRDILRATGIQYVPALPYTQHKKAVSEQMIRTITTKACTLLLDARLPAEFWAKAVQTAAYLHAHSPSMSNKGKAPFQMICNEKPEVHHLQRFGCLAYKWIAMSPEWGEKLSTSLTAGYYLGLCAPDYKDMEALESVYKAGHPGAGCEV